MRSCMLFQNPQANPLPSPNDTNLRHQLQCFANPLVQLFTRHIASGLTECYTRMKLLRSLKLFSPWTLALPCRLQTWLELEILKAAGGNNRRDKWTLGFVLPHPLIHEEPQVQKINSTQIRQQKTRAILTLTTWTNGVNPRRSFLRWPDQASTTMCISYGLVAVLCFLKVYSFFLQSWIFQWAKMTKFRPETAGFQMNNVELAIVCVQQYYKIENLWAILFFIQPVTRKR